MKMSQNILTSAPDPSLDFGLPLFSFCFSSGLRTYLPTTPLRSIFLWCDSFCFPLVSLLCDCLSPCLLQHLLPFLCLSHSLPLLGASTTIYLLLLSLLPPFKDHKMERKFLNLLEFIVSITFCVLFSLLNSRWLEHLIFRLTEGNT